MRSQSHFTSSVLLNIDRLHYYRLSHYLNTGMFFDIMFHMINKQALLVEVWCTLISLNFYLFRNNFASLYRGPKWVLFRLNKFLLEGLPECRSRHCFWFIFILVLILFAFSALVLAFQRFTRKPCLQIVPQRMRRQHEIDFLFLKSLW